MFGVFGYIIQKVLTDTSEACDRQRKLQLLVGIYLHASNRALEARI